MNDPATPPGERFALLVEEFRGLPDITLPSDDPRSGKKFGSSALKVKQKIFAMLVLDKLAVKLPEHRVEALLACGAGERFDPRHDGRLMKEWVTIGQKSEEGWLELAREAMEFVAAQR